MQLSCSGNSNSFFAESASICVLDTEWRSRLFPCRNSKRPSPVFLDHGRAAAMFAAAFPRRRLRFAFSRFCLRCAFGGSAALPLVGSARFLLLCCPCLSFVFVLAATLAACLCCYGAGGVASAVTFWSLHGRLILAVTLSRLEVLSGARCRFSGDELESWCVHDCFSEVTSARPGVISGA